MNRTLRLMAVLAHPDDESMGVGGVLAHYAAEGVAVSLVTATRGQRGRFKGIPPGEGHPGVEAMARIREAELRASAAVLGVGDLTILDYMDGELDRAEPREAIGLVAYHVRRLRPQVVLTFGQDGAYGHPDHIAICQFTTAAVVAAADADARIHDASLAPHAVSKLYYMADTAEMFEAYTIAFRRMVSMVDGVEREAPPWPEWEITTRVDTLAHVETVWKAVACHETQIAGYEKLRSLSPEMHQRLWGSRAFYRVFSTVNGGRQRETDLFEGLRAPGSSVGGA